MEKSNGYSVLGMTFEELSNLSPAELETIRQREVEACIKRAPERVQRRLRGLQFQIDARRKAHKSPLGACISISQMMQESLQRLHAALQGEELPERENAQVIHFPQFKQANRDQPRV